MIEALCPVGSQTNKIDLVEFLGYRQEDKKVDMTLMPPAVQLGEQVSLF
jgi:hypothetical protein